MLELFIKDDFICDINDGYKTTTIRKGERFISDRALIFIPTNDDGYPLDEDIVKAQIIGIKYKKLYEITNHDAEKDGFQDKRELEEILYSIYPDIDEETLFTIIEFEV